MLTYFESLSKIKMIIILSQILDVCLTSVTRQAPIQKLWIYFSRRAACPVNKIFQNFLSKCLRISLFCSLVNKLDSSSQRCWLVHLPFSLLSLVNWVTWVRRHLSNKRAVCLFSQLTPSSAVSLGPVTAPRWGSDI